MDNGKTRKAERAYNLPVMLRSSHCLSKVQYGLGIKNWTLQLPTAMQELTLGLDKSSEV